MLIGGVHTSYLHHIICVIYNHVVSNTNWLPFFYQLKNKLLIFER